MSNKSAAVVVNGMSGASDARRYHQREPNPTEEQQRERKRTMEANFEHKIREADQYYELIEKSRSELMEQSGAPDAATKKVSSVVRIKLSAQK